MGAARPQTPRRSPRQAFGGTKDQRLNDRERLWFELVRAGFAPEELRRVVRYLQKEIRAVRRNVGALKLSNLLHSDIQTKKFDPPRACAPANMVEVCGILRSEKGLSQNASANFQRRLLVFITPRAVCGSSASAAPATGMKLGAVAY